MAPPGSVREVLLPHQSKVGWIWGLARNDIAIPQPLMGFYWNMPQDAPCILSLPKARRCFKRGEIPHGRRGVAWDDDYVCDAAAALRVRRGPKMNTLVRPRTWEDMYQYFDAIDLWNMGAWNLWRVVHFACDENEGAPGEPSPSKFAASFEVVDEWAYDWCTHEEHRTRLSAWDERSDILCVLSPAEINHVSCCGIQELSVLRGALRYWSRFYKNQSRQGDNGQDVSAVSASSSNCRDAQDSLPTRALDDNDIALSRPEPSSIAPTSRPRRRSSSLSLPRASSRRDEGEYTYVANPAVVIMNGTTAARTHQLSSGSRPAEARTGENQGRGHKHSKSGPAPAVRPAPSLATRGAGVEGPGPSRLPSSSQNLFSRANGASRQPTQPTQPIPGSVEADIANRTGQDPHPRSQGSGHRARCPNHGRRNQGSDFRFAPCSCQQCVEKARSVHIAPLEIGDMSSREARAAIAEHLSQWGHVEGCELKKSYRDNYYALVRFSSEASAHLAVRRSKEDGRGHPRLGCFTISYPLRSKHFRPEPRPRLGSSGSHHSAGNGSGSPSSGGTGNLSSARDGGSPRYGGGSRGTRQSFSQERQLQQRFGRGSRSHHHQRAERALLSSIRTPPRRSLSQQFPDPPHPAAPGAARSHSMMQPGQHQHQLQLQYRNQHRHWPSSSAGAFSGSPSYENRPWSSHYCPRGAPSLSPHLPPPPLPGHYVPPPPYQPFFSSPYPHHAWLDMPMPPAASSYHPLLPLPPPPPPPHAQHYPGSEEARHPGFHCAAGLPQPPLPQPAYGCGTQPQGHSSPTFSAQTKPPSETEAFGSCPISSNASTHSAQSSIASTSVKVRLPELPQEKHSPDTVPTLPSHNRVKKDSPVRRINFGDVSSEMDTGEPAPVTVPDRIRARPNSSVRRITFGDFGPPETPGSTTAPPAAAGRSESTESTTPTPAAAPAPPSAPPAGSAMTCSGTRALTSDDDTRAPERSHAGRTQQPTPSTPTQQQHINGCGEPHVSHESKPANAENDDEDERGSEGQLDKPTTLPSRQNVGDVRLDPEYNATVIRRPPRHDRVYSSWIGDGFPPAAQPTYPDASSQPQAGGISAATWLQAQDETSPSQAWNPAVAPFAPPPRPQHYQHCRPGEPYMLKQKGKKRRNKYRNKSRLGSQTATRSSTPIPEAANNNNASAFANGETSARSSPGQHQDTAIQPLLLQSGEDHQPVVPQPQQQTPGDGGIANHLEEAIDGAETRNGLLKRDRKGKGKATSPSRVAVQQASSKGGRDWLDEHAVRNGGESSSTTTGKGWKKSAGHGGGSGGGGKSWHWARKKAAGDQSGGEKTAPPPPSVGETRQDGNAAERKNGAAHTVKELAHDTGEDITAAAAAAAAASETETADKTDTTKDNEPTTNNNYYYYNAAPYVKRVGAATRPSAYRANAGGSLRISRQRLAVHGGKKRPPPAARGDVRDLFRDHRDQEDRRGPEEHRNREDQAQQE
ncbi:uncharacterized protein P884DRAFT_266842 [Thermothelomyces heterothallicus CBS 202.75]|uniref:uncharacterized protein n=1 Tax=Thermothelomyces heterothallicus CBS 202.75 TaxID=1149848 RepID=UPI003743CEE4